MFTRSQCRVEEIKELRPILRLLFVFLRLLNFHLDLLPRDHAVLAILSLLQEPGNLDRARVVLFFSLLLLFPLTFSLLLPFLLFSFVLFRFL